MTIMEALNKIDSLKPNVHTTVDKIKWLSILDGVIKAEIIDTHHGGEVAAFEEYKDDDLLKTLLVPAPFDDIYTQWLSAQIDYANGEYDKYINSMAMYNSIYISYAKNYNKTHLPKNSGRFKF